jgi:LysR family transcriptional regulator, regulator for metE and metH
MNLEIRHLKLIAAIKDTGSMTRAGNRLHLTQSALSHQLRDAEETLGARLFVRQRGTMALTAAGERLLRSARAVIEELDRAEKEIRDANGNVEAERGLIRLSTECYTVYHWLPPRLKMFQQKFPSVEFQLVVEATDNPYESLLNGDLDVAIVCDPARNRRIRYTPLFEDELVVIVSPEHRMAGKLFAEPKDFTDETLLLFPPKSESSLLNEVLTPAGIVPRRIQELTLTEAIIDLVRGGLGIAAVARWAAAPQLASGAVVGLRLTADGLYRNWAAAQLRDKSAPPYLDEFVKVLAQLPLTACVPDFERVEQKKYRTVRTRRRSGAPSNRAGEPPVAVGSR